MPLQSRPRTVALPNISSSNVHFASPQREAALGQLKTLGRLSEQGATIKINPNIAQILKEKAPTSNDSASEPEHTVTMKAEDLVPTPTPIQTPTPKATSATAESSATAAATAVP